MSNSKRIDKVEGDISRVVGEGDGENGVENVPVLESGEENGGGGGDSLENEGGSGFEEEPGAVQRDASQNGVGARVLEDSGGDDSNANDVVNGNVRDHEESGGDLLPRVNLVGDSLMNLKEQIEEQRRLQNVLWERKRVTDENMRILFCEMLPALEREMIEMGMPTDSNFFTVVVPEMKRYALLYAPAEPSVPEGNPVPLREMDMAAEENVAAQAHGMPERDSGLVAEENSGNRSEEDAREAGAGSGSTEADEEAGKEEENGEDPEQNF